MNLSFIYYIIDKLTRCKLTLVEYTDLEKAESQFYNCPEDAVENGFCIFHVGYEDKNLFNKYRLTIIEKLQEKIDKSLRALEPLLCIKFTIPAIPSELAWRLAAKRLKLVSRTESAHV